MTKYTDFHSFNDFTLIKSMRILGIHETQRIGHD